MGLTSLWSNITGPRIKEIQPQTKCSWLEKNRPQTSASSRTAKKLSPLQIKPDTATDSRPTSSHSGKRKKRALSISRPKAIEESKVERKASDAKVANDVPNVPAIPAALSPRELPTDYAIRPGTAKTADESKLITEVFELAGDGLASPSLQSPLPSPLATSYPTSPESHLSVKSQASTPPAAEFEGGLRKRSNSTASGKPKHKRASWFSGSKKETEAALLPPLPPPSGPPPPTPVAQPIIAELPAVASATTSERPEPEYFPQTRTSATTEVSSTGDSILDAFPTVPTPLSASESSSSPEAIPPTSAVIEPKGETASGPATVTSTEIRRHSPHFSNTPRPRPIAVPLQTIDGLLAPDSSKDSSKRESKQLPALPSEAITLSSEAVTLPCRATAPPKPADHKSLSFGEELQQEYDRLMDLMGRQTNSGAIMSVMGEFDFNTKTSALPQKFSNDEALSKLEFGILK